MLWPDVIILLLELVIFSLIAKEAILQITIMLEPLPRTNQY